MCDQVCKINHVHTQKFLNDATFGNANIQSHILRTSAIVIKVIETINEACMRHTQ